MKESRIQFDNKKLLKTICEVYDYEVEYQNDKLEVRNDEETTEYNTVEEALIDFLPTLVESERQYIIEELEDITWIPEINQIKELRNNLKYNESSSSIKDNLTYGEIPNHMIKNISVFLDEQIKIVNSYNKLAKDEALNIDVMEFSLPVEFILENDEVKYIKIANFDFIERLMKGDTSEIEFDEVDIYDSECKNVDILPLMPFGSTKKFEITVPVALTLRNSYLTLQTPIDPLYLI